MGKRKLTLGSLFDGIGGFPLAAERCGVEPVWASEIEAFPISVTKRHFPMMRHLGDVTTVRGDEIEPVDIITFGSPCQDLSVAGKRAGLEGSRSSLFYEVIRIINEMRRKTDGRYPRFAVWENVPGALSSNKGEDFRAVVEAFAESGAVDVAWRILDARYFGVPQRRRRVFVVADFGGERARDVLFEREGDCGNPLALAQERESDVRRVDVSAWTVDCRNSRLNAEISGTIQAKENGSYSLNYFNPVLVDGRIRLLTEVETERLFGYPDGWTDVGRKHRGQVDTMRIRALGNSVAIPVVVWIMGRLVAVIDAILDEEGVNT